MRLNVSNVNSSIECEIVSSVDVQLVLELKNNPKFLIHRVVAYQWRLNRHSVKRGRAAQQQSKHVILYILVNSIFVIV